MAPWLIPALKAALPHIGSILSAAMPVFTKKNPDADADRALLQQQIAELQTAASQNTAHIKELAAQLQTTIAALEGAAAATLARNQRIFLLCLMAVLVSVVSLSIAVYLFFANS